MLSCHVISAMFNGEGGSCFIQELAEDCCRKQGDSMGGTGPRRRDRTLLNMLNMQCKKIVRAN